MMILKLKSFHRWSRSENVTDRAIKEAVEEIKRGLVDGNLGGGLLKKRVSRDGEGKRGGFRTLLAYRNDDRAIFILGFPKSERDNVEKDELEKFKKIAKSLLLVTDVEIKQAISRGELVEVK